MQFRKRSSTNWIRLALASLGPRISIIRVVQITGLAICTRLYLIDAIDALDSLRVSDAPETIGHEENNVGHCEDDGRGLRLASEGRRYDLAQGAIDTFKRCAGFGSYRGRECFEIREEKVSPLMQARPVLVVPFQTALALPRVTER